MRSSNRGLATVLGGNVGAQLIALLTIPLISRFFSPEEFGYLSLVAALAGILAPLATLRFDSAVMLSEDTEETRSIVWVTFCTTAVVGSAAAVTLQLLVVMNFYGLASFPGIPFWVSLIVILTAVYSLFTQLTLRRRAFAAVAHRTFWRSFATSMTQIGLGAFAKGWNGLLLGTAVGHSIGITGMLPTVREYLAFPAHPGMRIAWRKYWRFPVVFSPSAVLNVLGAQFPLIFFTAYFGLSLGGQLGMAERIVGLPLTVIGFAVSQVLQADIAQILRTRGEGLFRIYLRFSLLLGGLGVLIVLFFGLAGPWAIPLVLGESWGEAGQVSQMLALPSAVRLVASSLSNVLVLLQGALANLILDVLRVLLVVISAFLIVHFDADWSSSLLIFYSALTITYVATWFVGLYVTWKMDHRHSHRADTSS